MKTRIACTLIWLISLGSPVHSQWNWCNPLPQGNALYSTWFINSNLGYLVGNQRTVMKTTDGGITWTTRLPAVMDASTRLNGVCFPDENTGFIINLLKEVYKSEDAGETWDLIHTEPGYHLNAVFFTDPAHGFVACSQGRILRTSDGGSTWTTYDDKLQEDFTSVWFSDGQTGFVTGTGGLILHTTDGGNTWSPQVTATTSKLLAISFISPDVGVACGLSGTLLKTVNGGNTWTLQNFGDTVDLLSVSMVNADTVLLTGRTWWSVSMAPAIPFVMRSADGGNTWIKTTLNNYPTCVYSLHDGTAYLAGWQGYLAKTTDAGVTWDTLSSSLTSNWISAIDFPTANVGYAVSSYFEYGSEAILKTVNGGDTWSRLPYGDNTVFHAVDFVSSDYGCVGGADIYGTLDGGVTWVKRYTGFWYRMIRSICFSNTANGIAVGDSGIILHTTDIGQSWTRLPSSTTSTLRVVCFPDASTGYIGGNKILLKSVDGGATWTEKPMPDYIFGMHFTSSQVGVAVGAEMIIRTTDGGNTWTSVTPGNLEQWLYSVHFYDADTGYAAGGGSYPDPRGGCVWKTVDGGLTWGETKFPLDGKFYAIHVSPAYRTYAGGDAGFLFGTSNGGITGTNELSAITREPEFKAFPNPSGGLVTISYALKEGSEVKLELLDYRGAKHEMVAEHQQQNGVHRIVLNTSALNAGVYMLRLQTDRIVNVKKIVVR